MYSSAAYSLMKISNLSAYSSHNKYDAVCLWKHWLDSSTLCHDNKLEMPDYTLVRTDHPSNSKGSGICIYYRNNFP